MRSDRMDLQGEVADRWGPPYARRVEPTFIRAAC
jgi:hypothetical protein